eukprot:138963-Pyramimonas_sp.AAC.1
MYSLAEADADALSNNNPEADAFLRNNPHLRTVRTPAERLQEIFGGAMDAAPRGEIRRVMSVPEVSAGAARPGSATNGVFAGGNGLFANGGGSLFQTSMPQAIAGGPAGCFPEAAVECAFQNMALSA